MAEFSFGQVEAVLAAINGIADHKRVAFAGRLKFLQKNGLLDQDRTRPGRGRAGSYSFPQLMQLALGVELLAFGLTPQRAAQLVARNWSHIRYSSYLGTYSKEELRHAEITRLDGDTPEVEWLWLVHANALAELTAEGASEYDTYEAIEAVALSELPKMLELHGHIGDVHGRRTMLVNGSALTRKVLRKVALEFRFATTEAMRDALMDEARDENERLDRLGKILDAGLPKEKLAEIKERFANRQNRIADEAKRVLDQITPTARDTLAKISRDHQIVIDDLTRPGMIELAECGVFEVPSATGQGNADYSMVTTELGAAVMQMLREADVY